MKRWIFVVIGCIVAATAIGLIVRENNAPARFLAKGMKAAANVMRTASDGLEHTISGLLCAQTKVSSCGGRSAMGDFRRADDIGEVAGSGDCGELVAVRCAFDYLLCVIVYVLLGDIIP